MSSNNYQASPLFRMVRPKLSVNGMTNDTDPYVRSGIEQLEKLFSKRCFEESIVNEAEVRRDKKKGGDELVPKWDGDQFEINEENLDDVLLWDIDKLLKEIEDADEEEERYTFADIIDQRSATSLQYEVQEIIRDNTQSYNVGLLLKNKPIQDFLFARAVFGKKLNDAAAVYKYITDEKVNGIFILYNYLARNAAENIIKKERIDLGDDENGALERISIQIRRNKPISFTQGVFYNKIKSLIKYQVFDTKELKYIQDNKELLDIKDDDVSPLLAYIKKSKITINEGNAKFYLSSALNSIRNNGLSFDDLGSGGDSDPLMSGGDFTVNYYEEDIVSSEVSRDNIRCAAQLYYSMTLGDELGIFQAMELFGKQYLPGGLVDIRSSELMNDLRMYFFKEEFSEIRNRNERYDRTLPEERKMFYKQVFNLGDDDFGSNVSINTDFNTLWEILMMESVKYISKMEKSENPQFFVSRQNIGQAIEDLQENISQGCQGLAKMGTPLVNKELDFIVEKVFKNKEVIDQLAIGNKTSFWKVIERILKESTGTRPNMNAFRNKAVFGHKIITAIADYTPATLDDDRKFAELLGTIEAFIIANSQLEGGMQQNQPDNMYKPDMKEELEEVGAGSQDNWNF